MSLRLPSTSAGTLFRLARPQLFARALHTSRAAYAYDSDLPPSPKSAEALGFTPQLGRQRDLPEAFKIPISTSGRDDLFPNTPTRPGQRNRGRRNDSRRPRSPSNDTESEADFFGADSPSTQTQGGAAARSRRSLKGVSMDVVGAAESVVPPDVARRQRQRQRQTRDSSSHGKRTGAPGSGAAGLAGQSEQGQRQRRARNGDVNASPRDKRVMMPRRQLTLETIDHSSEGMFGKKGLVARALPVAGSVAHSLSHARKIAPIRQSNTLSTLPSSPLPIVSPAPSQSAQQAIDVASWSAALNASINPRAKSRLSDAVSAQLGR